MPPMEKRSQTVQHAACKSYRTEVRIPFQHVDAAGVLFFARLFEHAHQVYEGFMEVIGWPLPQLLGEGALMLPIVHAEADYRSPMRRLATEAHADQVCPTECVVERQQR